MMQEMMRNYDRALSNLKSLPGGFSALQRFYNVYQEPMYSAMSNQDPFASLNAANSNTTLAPPVRMSLLGPRMLSHYPIPGPLLPDDQYSFISLVRDLTKATILDELDLYYSILSCH